MSLFNKICPLDENCMLSLPRYFEALHEMASSAYLPQLCSECICNVGIVEEQKPNLDGYHGLQISPYNIHGGLALTLQPIKQPTVCNELYSAYHVLARQLLDGPRYSFCRFELLLWYAVDTGDVDLLKTILCQRSDLKLPKCLLAALLYRAIECYFDEIVQILLEFGASPDICIGSGSLMAPICLISCGNHAQIQKGIFIEEEHVKLKVENIVNYLLGKGADLMVMTTETREVPLHNCAHLALKSGEAAKRLIEMTPPAGLSLESGVVDRYESFKINQATPLETALIDMALVGSSPDKVVRILSSAILPMIKAGAVLKRESFSYAYPPETCLLVAFWWQCGDKLSHVLFKVMVEIACLSNLKPPIIDAQTWLRHLENLNEFKPRDPDALNLLQCQLVHHFPRSLLGLSRVAVLRRLPVGALARNRSIESLALPEFVPEILKFVELDRLLDDLRK